MLLGVTHHKSILPRYYDFFSLTNTCVYNLNCQQILMGYQQRTYTITNFHLWLSEYCVGVIPFFFNNTQ
jgi:hypothetical protein